MKTYYFRNAFSIELDITHAPPYNVHIELNTFFGCLVDIYIRELDRDVSEVELDETQIGKGTRKCRGEDGFNYVLGDLSASYNDIGP